MKIVKQGFFAFAALLAMASYGQVSVNVNIGQPPVWGPPVTVQEYYYLPDVESYYDLRSSQFIYLNRGNWVRSASLPQRYRSYDLNRGNVIVIDDYHGPAPYTLYKTHKVKYVKKWHPAPKGKHKGKAHGKHRH